jgi:Fe2+ or Zn2+ uptake regulation protein
MYSIYLASARDEDNDRSAMRERREANLRGTKHRMIRLVVLATHSFVPSINDVYGEDRAQLADQYHNRGDQYIPV